MIRVADPKHVMGYRPSTGHVCPLCASPKTLQATVCFACWVDRKRAEASEHSTRCPCPDCRRRESRRRHERRLRAGEIKGTATGRPQPASHPWRAT